MTWCLAEAGTLATGRGQERKGLLFGWTRRTFGMLTTPLGIYTSPPTGKSDFSRRLRKLRIRQREANTKEAFHIPVIAFKLAQVVMGQAHIACLLCPG